MGKKIPSEAMGGVFWLVDPSENNANNMRPKTIPWGSPQLLILHQWPPANLKPLT